MKKIITLAILLLNFSCEKNNQEIKNTEKTEVKVEEKISEPSKEADILTLKEETVKIYEIKSEKIRKKIYTETIQTSGLIKETEDSVYKIVAPVQGKILYDGVKVGDYVSSGQKIATIQNSEVVKIYANYIHEAHNNEILLRQAKIKLNLLKKNLDREKSLFDQGISAKKDYDNSNTEYELAKSEIEGLNEHRTHLRAEAEALLLNYGVKLGKTESETIQSVSPIITNHGGIVTKKYITEGSVVTVDHDLYDISDLSKVYLNINIQDKDIKNIDLGQPVIFTSESTNKSFSGTINYINPDVNPETKAFVVRAVLPNPNGALKSGAFGKVNIELNKTKPLIFIPNESLQTYNNQKFVFIDIGNYKYKKVVINPEKTSKEGFYITQGLKENQKIVISGAFILKSELLKDEFKEEE